MNIDPFEMNFKRTLQWIKTIAVESIQCGKKYANQADQRLNNWLQKENILSDNIICALNEENQGFCTGDSGSPLTSLEDNTLVGIVSSSFGCAR